MRFKKHKFLSVFIFLLTTVFLVDTVYASGTMVASQLFINQNVASEHCLQDDTSDTETHHNHDSQKNSADDGCAKCSHCMACFTVIPPSKVSSIESHTQYITANLLKPSYISHVTASLQRPPIS